MAASIGLGVLACAEEPAGPAPEPAFEVVAGNENGALISVGEWSPGQAVYRDPDSQLLLYARFNNGFCNAAGTQFVTASYRDVIRTDEAWRTVEKAEGVWLYVYHWTGQTVTCSFLVNNPPIATGRGTRMYTDNDFYPFAPYGPGPGMNSYRFAFHGRLTTAADEPAALLGFVHGLFDKNGDLAKWNIRLQLSPDPRQ